MEKNYKKTKMACYLGFITQAISANFAPLLFLALHSEYGVSLGKIAMIPTCFFFTQILVDLFCAKYVDKIGYRFCIILSEVLSALGLIGLGFLPEYVENPFLGIIISVFLYSIGSGLIEVLCSPIIEACPFKDKDATMSLLHSFYCWGVVGTVLVSTAFLSIFGMENRKWLALIWSMIPIFNIYNFSVCPIENIVEDGKGMRIGELLKNPVFIISIGLMICSGASELTMSQWASAYAEATLGLSKSAGDLLGPCLFAVTMGISRLIYGKFGNKMDLHRFMIGSGILSILCYCLAAFFNSPVAGLTGCILCGFSVGIMWPGTLSISAKKFTAGGTAMFALLAMAGDIGGSLGPGIAGKVTELAGDNLRAGMKVGLVFPIGLVILLIIFKRMSSKANHIRLTSSKLSL